MNMELLENRKILYRKIIFLLLKVLDEIPSEDIEEIKTLDELLGKFNNLNRVIKFKK